MKRSDTGDFCVLYVEPNDEKSALFQLIMAQKKPIVIMLAEQARIFQRPEDFADLKHIRRHLDRPVLFVIPGSERLVHLAGRNGFPVYLSMDALATALAAGQVGKPRGGVRKTIPLSSAQHEALPRKTGSLHHADEAVISRKTTSSPSLPGLGMQAYPARGVPARASAHPTGNSVSQQGVHQATPPPNYQPRGQNQFGEFPAEGWSPDGMSPPSAGNALPFRHGEMGNNVAGPGQPAVAVADERPALKSIYDMSTQGWGSSPSRSALSDVPTRPIAPLMPAPPPPKARPQVNRLQAGILILILIALITAGLGYFMVTSHNLAATASPVANTSVGQVTFLSSDQLSESSSQGLDDKVMVDLTNIPPAAAGKSYYAWLVGDKGQGDMKSILLGTLNTANGHARLLYPGDQNHTNLLAITSRFLVTEQDAGLAPLTPSPDYKAWRFYGEISQSPINASDNTQHFSYLDHLRHLLASDPTLDELELPGGLNTWFDRNVSKIVEWTGSTREQWQETQDVAFVRRQTLRTLTYLDGVSFVTRDLPPNTGLNVNERLARIGLLDVAGATQDPASYLAHISHHLYGLLQVGTATPALRAKVAAIVAALDAIKTWLEQVRQDALQIMKMSDQNLRQPTTLSLLNDMISNASHAFTGQVDATTGQMHPGVTWVHDQMQSLATFNVTIISASGGPVMQVVPDLNVRRVNVPDASEVNGAIA